MADRPQTPPKDNKKTASIRDVYKAYKSKIKKWHPHKHSSSTTKPPQDSSNLNKDNQRNAICTIQDAGGETRTYQALDKEEEQEETMNGVHDFLYNTDRMKVGGEPTSPRGFFNKHRSMDNFFSSIPSPLSRSSSRRSQTPSRTPTPHQAKQQHPSFLQKSVSRRSAPDSPAFNSSLSRSASRRSSTPIMYSNSNGLIKPPAIEKRLECTLEELCFGCVKKIKITRDVVTKTGQIVQEEELLTIKVKPGWKRGTKITFEGMGDERPGTYPADITFLIGEKRHPLFRREGDDLELAVEIPLVKALTGCTISIPLLGGDRMALTIDDIIYPGYEKIIAGQGMPVSKELGRRGSLKIIFLIEFPTDLTDEQRSDASAILEDCC